MGYTTCGMHRGRGPKCCWRCDACPKCDGVRLLRGGYCVECTAKFKAEGAVWVQDYQNYISAEDYARVAPKLTARDLGVDDNGADAVRACADCEGYNREAEMIKKADGRVICPACQKAIDSAAIKKAQGDLFTSQPALF